MLLQPRTSTLFLTQIGFKKKDILFAWASTYAGSKSYSDVYRHIMPISFVFFLIALDTLEQPYFVHITS